MRVLVFNSLKEYLAYNVENDDICYVKSAKSWYQNGKVISNEAIVTEIPEDMELKKGKSAYDVAVERGFKGTETEWLASLRGKEEARKDLVIDIYNP